MADIKVNAKYIKVINPDGSIGVSDYFESVRIETLQPIEQADIITDITIDNLPKLPDEGLVIKNKLYQYNGIVVHCIQEHQRTIYPPEETPALFAVYRDNSDTLIWIENEKVCLGWKRVHNNILYECIQAHMTLQGWEPNMTSALWKLAQTEEIPVWVQPTGAHDAYNIGDKVHFPTINDPVYESLINANVWSPTIYPQGWKKL